MCVVYNRAVHNIYMYIYIISSNMHDSVSFVCMCVPMHGYGVLVGDFNTGLLL